MHRKLSSILAAVVIAAAATALVALGTLPSLAKDMKQMPENKANYSLEFRGNASFNKPHGGQTVHVALVRADTGDVVAEKDGIVSKTHMPAFDFNFFHEMKPGQKYEVDYWIDSNFGGGKKGRCDATSHDHQWRVSLGTVDSDLTRTDSHRPAETRNVCKAFPGMN